jgi:hypothetical protein
VPIQTSPTVFRNTPFAPQDFSTSPPLRSALKKGNADVTSHTQLNVVSGWIQFDILTG